MKHLNNFNKWHRTRKGLIVVGIIELAIAYVFASWALDTASMWTYFFAIVFGIGGIHNLVKVLQSYVTRGKSDK